MKSDKMRLEVSHSLKVIQKDFFNIEEDIEIHIPLNIEMIEEDAFSYDKNLESITIPDSVTSIGQYAFCMCYKLQSFVFPNSISEISDGFFTYCELLQTVSIPETITYIGSSAFNRCLSLHNVVVPRSVIKFGVWTFDSCSYLDAIFYKGTEIEWNAIENSNNSGLYEHDVTTLYFYSENKPTTSGNYWHYVGEIPTVWSK